MKLEDTEKLRKSVVADTGRANQVKMSDETFQSPQQKALLSTDPQEIKAARSVIKGKLTSASNSFGGLNDLKVKDGKFDHEKINSESILVAHEKLITNFELVNKLHDVYCGYRERGEDEALAVKDVEYLDEIEKKVCESLDVYSSYTMSHLEYLRKLKQTRLRKKPSLRRLKL